MTESHVTYQLEDGIGVITMDDGRANALSSRMIAEVGTALDQAEADDAVVVLQGRPGIFSAGFDLPTLTAGGSDALTMLETGFELAERLLRHPRPVVTSSDGHTIAMGAFLFLTGDLRIGTRGPFKIMANEVAIGMTMPLAAIAICRLRLTTTELQRAMLIAQPYSPEAAVGAGFVHELADPEGAGAAARSAALRLKDLHQGAYQGTKERLNGAALDSLRAAIATDQAALRTAFA